MTIKILCDVHIAMKVVRFFQSKGQIAKHVNDILDGSETKDSDISDYIQPKNKPCVPYFY